MPQANYMLKTSCLVCSCQVTQDSVPEQHTAQCTQGHVRYEALSLKAHQVLTARLLQLTTDTTHNNNFLKLKQPLQFTFVHWNSLAKHPKTYLRACRKRQQPHRLNQLLRQRKQDLKALLSVPLLSSGIALLPLQHHVLLQLPQQTQMHHPPSSHPVKSVGMLSPCLGEPCTAAAAASHAAVDAAVLGNHRTCPHLLLELGKLTSPLLSLSLLRFTCAPARNTAKQPWSEL